MLLVTIVVVVWTVLCEIPGPGRERERERVKGRERKRERGRENGGGEVIEREGE